MAYESIDGLTKKQEQAIIALIDEPTIAKAAERINMRERNLYRWLNDPDFVRAYRAARREAFAQAIALTQKYTPHAIATLARLMSDPGTPAGARVSAACAILKFARNSIELDELTARLEEVEQMARSYGLRAPVAAPHRLQNG